MQNMWISVALIVAVIIVGIIAGKRLSTPGPQRRAVYFAFGTSDEAARLERVAFISPTQQKEPRWTTRLCKMRSNQP